MKPAQLNTRTLRLIVKQVSKIKQLEPALAAFLTQTYRQHARSGPKPLGTTYRITKHLSRVPLEEAFLNFLRHINEEETYFSRLCRQKLIEVYCGVNVYVDQHFEMRGTPVDRSLQLTALKANKQYQGLKTQEDRRFVERVVRRIFEGNLSYECTSLNAFLIDNRTRQCKLKPETALNMVRPGVRDYVQQVISGGAAVSRNFANLYCLMFASESSPYQLVLQSYLNSGYIMQDIDRLGGARQ